MAVTDYNKVKPLEVDSVNDSGSTIDKAQPVLLQGFENYNLQDVSATGDEFSVTSFGNSVVFNDTGSKMYVADNSDGIIYEYSLTSNYQIETASSTGNNLDVSSEDATPRGLGFNQDGTILIVSGTETDSCYQYNLSTGFDLSTASYSGNSLDSSSEDTFIYDVQLYNNADNLLLLGDDNDSIYEYSLTSGDLSTASYTGNSFSVNSEEDSLEVLIFLKMEKPCF